MTAPLADRVVALVGHIVDPPAACPSPTHTAPAECPAFRALAARLLAVADGLDTQAAGIHAAGTPDTTPAAAWVVERDDRAAGLMRAAEDIRGALSDTLGRVPHA